MAHFYGTIQGSRGRASRLGTKVSGLTSTAASWSGAVKTTLYHDDKGRDCALVKLVPWHGQGTYRTLYDGPVGG